MAIVTSYRLALLASGLPSGPPGHPPQCGLVVTLYQLPEGDGRTKRPSGRGDDTIVSSATRSVFDVDDFLNTI